MPRGAFRINTLAVPANMFVSSSRTAKTITVGGNTKVSTTQSKFDGASANFDGTGDYLNVASDADFGYGTGDFAIEFWLYRTVGSAYQVPFDQRTAEPNVSIALGIDNLNRQYCYINGAIRIQSTTATTVNTWQHWALTRSGTSLKLWLDGTQVGSTYTDSNNYASKPVRLGTDYVGTYGFTGYIDEIRITKGAARYTSAFTPSASAFTNDGNTVLLVHCNGTNNSTTFTDDVA